MGSSHLRLNQDGGTGDLTLYLLQRSTIPKLSNNNKKALREWGVHLRNFRNITQEQLHKKMFREGKNFSLSTLSHVPRGNCLARKSSPPWERKQNSVSDQLSKYLEALPQGSHFYFTPSRLEKPRCLGTGRKRGLPTAPTQQEPLLTTVTCTTDKLSWAFSSMKKESTVPMNPLQISPAFAPGICICLTSCLSLASAQVRAWGTEPAASLGLWRGMSVRCQ